MEQIFDVNLLLFIDRSENREVFIFKTTAEVTTTPEAAG